MASDKEIEHWLRGTHDDVRVECIDIIHPSFTKHYRFTRNATKGVRIKTEDGYWRDYEYLPMSIKPGTSADDLQQSFTIGIGDVGEIMPRELDRLRKGSYPQVRPTVNYRVYLTSDLSEPSLSVRGLEVTDNQQKKEGAVFACKARELNKNSTGITFNYSDFAALRYF